MTARQYLSQIEILEKRIQNKLAEESQLRSLATSISSPAAAEHVQTSGSGDRVGDIVAKIVDVQAETDELVKSYLSRRSEIIHAIESVEQLKPYEALFKRYVEYKTLEEISDEMGYSIAHIKRLLGEGTESVRKIKGFER